MSTEPAYNFGYAINLERRNDLEATGEDPKLLLKKFADSFPKFETDASPLGVVDILDQGNQSACQGHSLASIFQICFFLATGRKASFSRAAAYYLSQRFDGIRGDSGSTLSGGNKVATEHGLCYESDWQYPSRYNPAEPAGVKYPFRLKRSRPLTTVQEINEWNDAGLPIQTGFLWNSTCEKEIVDNWQALRGSGGHSTYFWQRNPKTGNIWMPNSWRFSWMGDGMNEWTERSIAATLRSNFTVYVGYSPDEMSFPDLEPIS